MPSWAVKALPMPSICAQTGVSAQYMTPSRLTPAALASWIAPKAYMIAFAADGKKSALVMRSLRSRGHHHRAEIPCVDSARSADWLLEQLQMVPMTMGSPSKLAIAGAP